ncbi:MAG TPA: DNA polymerase III subunit [Bryobacteraceae bacterium]|nr:DNA polymerase III subunit [Bryobacteraceae bacterium]
MIENFLGNPAAAAVFDHMIRDRRISQTILLAGPEGVGKATLARRFAAALLGDPAKIERDDLFLSENASVITERERWTAEKRNEDPLLFASHPDFVTFAPDGPLRQISIQQMRLLKERAQYKPLRGDWRVFLIDHIDRANEQAANSLLKTLEEPPSHLVLIMTAENAYDLLPTIRSRAVIFQMNPLGEQEMEAFAQARGLTDAPHRMALASGSPGAALSLDLEAYEKRRAAMLTLLQVASSGAPFAKWTKYSESIGASKSEKLEYYLKVLYVLLEDLLILHHTGGKIRNSDIRRELEAIAPAVSFEWLYAAVRKVDELAELLRRNIQKSIALDALAVGLRAL